jgi:uncharacterized membrane protein YidH (DUF202 family)
MLYQPRIADTLLFGVKMKDLKWLLLSIFGTFTLFGYLVVSLDCNFFGIKEWRGETGTDYALVLVTIILVSLFTTIFQLFKFTNNSTKQFAQTINPRVNSRLVNAVWLLMAVLFVFLFVMHRFFTHLCH